MMCIVMSMQLPVNRAHREEKEGAITLTLASTVCCGLLLASHTALGLRLTCYRLYDGLSYMQRRPWLRSDLNRSRWVRRLGLPERVVSLACRSPTLPGHPALLPGLYLFLWHDTAALLAGASVTLMALCGVPGVQHPPTPHPLNDAMSAGRQRCYRPKQRPGSWWAKRRSGYGLIHHTGLPCCSKEGRGRGAGEGLRRREE